MCVENKINSHWRWSCSKRMGWMPHSWHSKNEDELNSLVIESVPNKQVNKSSAARSFHIVKAKPLCMSAKSARCCPKYSSFIGFYSLWFDWYLMYKKHVQIQRFVFDLELRTPNSSKISRSISTWLHCRTQGYMARCVMSLGATS